MAPIGVKICMTVDLKVTTCLENLEMSGNSIAVREMSGILLKITECRRKILSGKSCLKLFIISCIFASIQVFSIGITYSHGPPGVNYHVHSMSSNVIILLKEKRSDADG